MKSNPLCEIDILSEEIQAKIQRDDLKEGLGKYIYLINRFHDENVFENEEFKEFKKIYDNFFQLAMPERNPKFRDQYHEYMRRGKNNKEMTLKEVLMHLKELHNEQNHRVEVEGSFGSKLLSMINPVEKTPWDSEVETNLRKFGILKALGIKVPNNKDVNERICEWDTFYTKICELYKDFVNRKTEARETWMNLFDQLFDEWYEKYFLCEKKADVWFKWLRERHFSKQDLRKSITDVKIIDLILWQIRAKPSP